MPEPKAGSVTAPPKVRNLTGSEWCEWCGGVGWVKLVGTTTLGGREYERGMTACAWCEQGVSRLRRSEEAQKKGHASYGRIETNVGVDDVVPVGSRRPGRIVDEEARTLVWLNEGYARNDDGELINVYTGQPASVLAPERLLPVLPNGTHLSERDHAALVEKRRLAAAPAKAAIQSAFTAPVTASELEAEGLSHRQAVSRGARDEPSQEEIEAKRRAAAQIPKGERSKGRRRAAE